MEIINDVLVSNKPLECIKVKSSDNSFCNNIESCRTAASKRIVCDSRGDF